MRDRPDDYRRGRVGLLAIATAAIVLLLVATVLTLGAQTYYGTQALLRENAATLSGRIRGELTTKIQQILSDADAQLDLLVHGDLPQAGYVAQWVAEIPLILSALKGKSVIDAAYVGYPDGSFVLFRPLAADRGESARDAPSGAALLMQSITRGNAGNAVGEYRYFDAGARLLRTDTKPEYTFDPRQRAWYVAAERTDGTIMTEPYVFYTSRMIGTTLARRASNGAVAGVDVALTSLAAALRELRITPGTDLAIVGAGDRVIAHPDATRLLATTADNGVRLPTIGEVGAPLKEASARLAQPGSAGEVDVGGRGWHMMRSDLGFHGQPLKVLLAVPTDELFAGVYRILRGQGLAAVAFLAIAVAAGVWIARAIARPIQQLAREARTIAALDFRGDVNVSSVIEEVESLARAITAMKVTVRTFVRVGEAMATERRLPNLLERVVTEAVAIAAADGGVVFLVDPDGRRLVPHAARWNGENKIDIPAIVLGDPASPSPIVDILDTAAPGIRELAVSPAMLRSLGFQASSDGHGSRNHVALAMPFLDRSQTTIGILLVILPAHDAAVDGARGNLKELLTAIGSGAGIAIENQQLFQGQKDLLDALIKLMAGAIDAKSAHTGAHCQRVPALTAMMAEAACAATDGPYKEFRLSEEEWEAVEIVAWLHDCGKLTTPEHVVDKATKLETVYDRIHEVRMRFEVLKRDVEIDYWRSLAHGANEPEQRVARDEALKTLDDEFAFVASCNLGGESMDEARVERLRRIGARRWRRTLDDRIGISDDERARKARTPPAALPVDEPLLDDRDDHVSYRLPEELLAEENAWGIKVDTPPQRLNRGELYNLTTRRGTLTAEERYIINDHMTQTIMMLQGLPFPRHLRAVPEIAGGHHERMDGTGYPKRLTRDQMSPVARMMAIADVFEALTAGDRPYKKAMPVSEALRIMAVMKRDHHLDPDLLDLFVSAGIWRRYGEQYLRDDQMDEPDLAFVLGMRPR